MSLLRFFANEYREYMQRQYAFCPTGSGGGIDNSCSPTGEPGSKHVLPESYSEMTEWVNKRSQEYGGKNKFLTSDEYRNAYPYLMELYKAEKQKTAGVAAKAMAEVGAKEGDQVFYDYVNPFGVEKYSGRIVLRDGIPYVKLDEGQQTLKGSKSVRWHKGWRRV